MKLTNEQIIKMAKLAIMASVPMGMGFLHHKPDMTEADITDLEVDGNGLYIDYYQGRMVKFCASKYPDGSWSFGNVSFEYQSWICKYPSYEKLAEMVIKG